MSVLISFDIRNVKLSGEGREDTASFKDAAEKRAPAKDWGSRDAKSTSIASVQTFASLTTPF